MGIIEWFSLFKFSWLRRCKACGVRGSKCLCRRPSLALEHIFFLEERKNKFGARNFSHVSDTMMTSASTMFTNSTGPVGGVVTCNNAAAGPRSSVSTSTVLMHGAGSFAESELNPTDYYYQTAVPPPPSSSSDSNGGGMTPHQPKKAAKDMQQQQHQQRKRVSSHHGHEQKQRSHSGYARKSPKAAEFTALVRKQSGRMVKKTRFHGDTTSSRPPFKEIVTGDCIVYSEKNAPVSLPARQQQQQMQRRSRRRSRVQANAASESKMATTQQQKGDQGVSFQFFGRGGSGLNGAAAAPASTSLSISSSCSTNDSLMLGSNSISSMRVSQYTDRMSLETNFSSYNPRSRLLENGYAPSIQEDAEALQTLNGWLLESPTSTQDSFMMSRCL